MLISTAQMKRLEADAFAAGVTPDALMEIAGEKIALAVSLFFPKPGDALIYYGKGHNGGDALVAARHLGLAGWQIRLRPAFANHELAPLTRQKLDALETILPLANRQLSGSPLIILDGLLGIGAHGELREPIRTAAREINRLRDEKNARIFAIDLPTGLDDETGEPHEDCVRADFTLTVGVAKHALVADAAINHVGRIEVLSLPQLAPFLENLAHDSLMTSAQSLAPLIPRRSFDTHKGMAGRIGIVAGSVGFTGAAIMASEAALRAGGGLITLYVTPEIYPIVAVAISPEIMVQPVKTYREIFTANHDVLAVGPGLGKEKRDEILDLVVRWPKPMIVDADALNALATQPELLKQCAASRLLTPHPGEMQRLFPTKLKDRRAIAEAFVNEFPATLLFKGARTIVAERGKSPSYNATGTPAMASGGMGDILTGTCASLAARGLSLFDAARLGAWICGRAAEMAVSDGESEESLTATDLLAHFGAAFDEIRDARTR